VILLKENSDVDATKMRRFLIIHKFSVLKHYLVSKGNTLLFINIISDSSVADNTSVKTLESTFENSTFKKFNNKGCLNTNIKKSFNN
jgi:hypothetical protein